MKITAQEEYGLRCLLRLAQAEEGQSLTIPDVAAAEGLSAAYVAKLLGVLRQAEIIDSVRGRAGGYRLCGAAASISVAVVLRALGEPLFDDPGYCQRYPGTETETCVHHGSCTLRELWQILDSWMRRALDQITLADLLLPGGRITELLRERLADAILEAEPAPRISLTALTTN